MTLPGLELATRVDTSLLDSIYINVQSSAYGAVGDGVNDDTAAIQLALDAAVAIGAQTVYLPDGNYKITSTLTVGTTAAFTSIGIIGSGGLVGTTITWAGSTSGTAVKIVRGRNNHIRDLFIDNGVAIGTTIGVLMTGPASGSQCSGCHFERVVIRDFKVNCQAGEVSINSSASELLFEDCVFDGSGGSGGTGFLNPTANSLVNLFVGCGFAFLDFGIDIQAGGCTHVVGGGFSRGGTYMRVATSAATLVVIGPRFELNPTDIIINTTNPASVRLEGALIAANTTIPTAPVIQGRGQFAILNNTFGQGTDTGWIPIEVTTQGVHSSLVMEGNKIWGTNPFYINPSSSDSNYLTYELFGNEKWVSGAFDSRFPNERGQVIWPDKVSFRTLASGYGGSSYSPAQITANQNNYQPQNVNTAGAIAMPMYLHLSTDASRNITGIKFSIDPVDGDTFTAINSGSNNVVLKHQDTNSTAAYRMKMATAADITLGADQSALFIYRGGSVNRWLVFSSSTTGLARTDTVNTFSETQTFSKAPVVPTSAGTAVWGLDASGGATLSIANDATATPFSNTNNFSGLLMINDPDQTGQTGLFIVGGSAAVVLIGQSGTLYSHTQGTAGKVNVYAVSNVITIENKQGNTIGFRVLAIRLRTSG